MLKNKSYDIIDIQSSKKNITVTYYSDNNVKKEKLRYRLFIKNNYGSYELFIVDDDFNGYSSDDCFRIDLYDRLTKSKRRSIKRKIYNIIENLFQEEYMNNYIFNGIPSHHLRNTKLKTLKDIGNRNIE